MRLWLLLCGLLLALVALAAEAGMKAGPNMAGPGHHRLKAAASDIGPPLDGLTTPTGAYGFRKLRTAYAGSAMRIRRASDNLEADIGFLGGVPGSGAPWDEAAAATHCAATSCAVVTWYDQSGNARHLTQATAANQPPVTLGCQNFLSCFSTAATNFSLNGASFTPATGLATLAAVGQRNSGTGTCTFFRENGSVNRLTAAGTANNWGIFPAAITAAAADNLWHAAVGVLHPTAGQSVLNIDGTETAGTTVPTSAAGVPGVIGVAATACREVEAIFWDNYALTGPERAVLVNNQRSFWGF